MTGPNKIFVYGAGGHGKVVADILLSGKDPRFAGFIDDHSELRQTTLLGYPVFGDGIWLRNEAAKTPIAVALGVGDNYARQKVAQSCAASGVELLILVHPAATVSESARLGAGTVVMARAAINPGAVIGEGAIVNTGAVVEHDVEIGDYAHVSPNTAMGGASGLGEFSHLGIGAVAIHGVKIGAYTIVGAGAVVVRDLPERVVALGVPAKVYRKLSAG